MAEKRGRKSTVPFADVAPATIESSLASTAAPVELPSPADLPAPDTAIAATFAADVAPADMSPPVPEPVHAIAIEAPQPPAPAPAAAATDFAADLTSNPGSPATGLPFLKGLMKMATAPETTYAATERFQAMFGDVNERAKSAVEKTTKLAEELTELTKGNVEAIVASGRVAAKGAEAMTQDVAEFGKKSFESATGALKSFAAVKSPTELFQLQSEYAKSSFDTAVAEASKFSESMLKLMGEIAQPLSSRYAVAAEKFKTTSF